MRCFVVETYGTAILYMEDIRKVDLVATWFKSRWSPGVPVFEKFNYEADDVMNELVAEDSATGSHNELHSEFGGFDERYRVHEE
jgi:hypothetical protein